MLILKLGIILAFINCIMAARVLIGKLLIERTVIMNEFLNLGIMQSTGSTDFETSLKRIEENVEMLMGGSNKPELICGVEMGIGFSWEGRDKVYEPIPGEVTNRLSKLAKKYGIYFVPGSMVEAVEKDGEQILYNSIPIFGPDGQIMDVYRKMCPYYPDEEIITKGDRFVVFEIPEKNIKVGVINCHDWCFPEMSRAVTLMGAEIILRPAVDPEGLYENCKGIAPTRALENQAYFVSLNMVGEYLGNISYGHSCIAGPDGKVIYEAGSTPVHMTITLDMKRVRDARRFGTNYTDQFLRQYKYFNIKNPYEGKLGTAPIYDNLPDPDLTVASKRKDGRENGIMTIGNHIK